MPWRKFLLAKLKLQLAFLITALVLMQFAWVNLGNSLPLLAAVMAGTLAGAACFFTVLLLVRSRTHVGAVLRVQICSTAKVLGPMPLSAIGVLSLAAGVSEELLFRAVIQGWLTENVHYAVGIGISAIVFGWMHRGSAATFIFTSLYGLLFGFAYHLSESLAFVAAWHIVYDFFALLFIVKAPHFFGVSKLNVM